MKKLGTIILVLLSVLNVKSQTPLPQKIDLSTYCPHQRTQFKSTCYAYAFAYTALTMNYCIKNNITNPEGVESNAFSYGFVASMHRKQTRFNPRCGKHGSYDIDIEIFKEYGCPKLKDFDFDCTKEIPDDVIQKAKQIKLKDYKYIQENEDTSAKAITRIKEILSKNIPVLIVLKMTDDFAELGRDCNEVLPKLKMEGKSNTAHDICIIGYDDDVNSKYFGRFLVKNNFAQWGDFRNMAWVKYEDMMYMITHVLYFTIQ